METRWDSRRPDLSSEIVPWGCEKNPGEVSSTASRSDSATKNRTLCDQIPPRGQVITSAKTGILQIRHSSDRISPRGQVITARPVQDLNTSARPTREFECRAKTAVPQLQLITEKTVMELDVGGTGSSETLVRNCCPAGGSQLRLWTNSRRAAWQEH